MAKEKGVLEIKEFMDGPLVAWFSSCLDPLPNAEKLTYEEIIDGVLIHHVFLQMDLYCQDSDIIAPAGDASVRARNLKKVLNNMRQFYEEELHHVVIRLPDVSRLSREPLLHVADAQLLLKLLLGCAAICPRNDRFVGNIKKLELPIQMVIAENITQVLHVPGIILSKEMLQVSSNDSNAKIFEIVRQVCRVKEYYKLKLKSMAKAAGLNKDGSMMNQTIHMTLEEEEQLEALSCSQVKDLLDSSIRSDRDESQVKDAELLAEAKSKLRKQQEELDKTIEDLTDARCEIKTYEEQLIKMRQENEKLASEVRSVKQYRDELDAANEKAERADRLEQEIVRYKEKLAKVDFSEGRIRELREENDLLLENKRNLDEQLKNYKQKTNQVIELEQQLYQLNERMEELSQENAASREKYRKVCEDNEQLELLIKTSTKETLDNGFIVDSDDSASMPMNNSLFEQLNNSAQSAALKLEIENRRLSNLLDLKENSIQEESTKLLDVQKDNKRLSTLYDGLRNQLRKLTKKHEVLQDEHNKLVQDTLIKDRNTRKKEQEIERLTQLLKQQEEKFQEASAVNSLTDSQKELSIVNSLLVAEKEFLLKSKEKLTGDLEHLKSLHDQLNTDYQQVLQDRNQLRTRHREDKLTIRRQAEYIDNLESRVRLLEEERTFVSSDKIVVEYAQLEEEFYRLFKSNEKLLVDYKHLMNELNKRHCQEPELREKSQKIVELEIELNRVQQRLDVLEQMNSTLEQDKHSLMQHNDKLLKQNHQLVTQALDDLRDYHKEELKNTDQVNNLKRQKEKLEEKIMDQYRRQEPASTKKKSSRNIVKKTLVRVTRAGSEFFLNRTRRSLAEETRLADEPSFDFEYTRGHESDGPLSRPTSSKSDVNAFAADCPRNRKSVDFLENFDPSRFTFDELQERSRKSLDFAELCSLYKNEENESMNKTLNNTTNMERIDEFIQDDQEDCTTFGKNKSVDLSFEKDQTEVEFAAAAQENNDHEMSQIIPDDSRQSVWLDHGCV